MVRTDITWQPLTPQDIPDFVSTLRHYSLSMDDETARFPLQSFTLRLSADNAEYYKVPGLGYLALDPIGLHDAVVHFFRDPTSRAKKQKYLDTGRKFMVDTFYRYNINRLTLIVVEGSYQGAVPMDTYASLLGFTYEGTLRQSRYINEKPYDLHLFGVLRGEV